MWEVWGVWEDGEEVLSPTLPTLPTLLFPLCLPMREKSGLQQVFPLVPKSSLVNQTQSQKSKDKNAQLKALHL